MNRRADDSTPDLWDPSFGFTDLGNARRLALVWGGRLQWAPTWGWMHWSGQHWESLDDAQVIHRCVAPMVDELTKQAFTAFADKADRKAALAWARKSEGASRLSAAASLVRGPLHSTDDAFNPASSDWLLNVDNGTIDLRTGQLLRPSPEHGLVHLLPWQYNPHARCSRWREFIDWMTCHNHGVAGYLQRVAGYCLTADTGQQIMPILHGDGANGKSVFGAVLRAILGPTLSAPGGQGLVVKTGRDDHLTQLWAMRGRRFILVSETERDARLDEERVKMLTGGDTIAAREVHQKMSSFRPTHKIMLLTNPRPQILGDDHAIWRRLHLVHCQATVADGDIDPDLLARLLREEAEGILAWCVEGAMQLHEDGRLRASSAMVEAVGVYREEQDTLGLWLEECCVLDTRSKTETELLYGNYRSWLSKRGQFAKSVKVWSEMMRRRGFEATRIGERGIRGWAGVRLHVLASRAF
jgi:putative DNA primase/helicase